MTQLEKKFVNSKEHGQRNIKMVENLTDKFDISDIKDVLEIGCGVGILATHLNQCYSMNVIGIDVDPEQITLAKEHQEEKESLQFMVADASKLVFSEDQKFDLAISTFVLHHIPNWEDVLNEIGRVLKHKGFYIFHDITYPKILVKLFRHITKKYGVYTADEISDCMYKNKFKIIYLETTHHAVFKVYSIIFQKD